MERYRVKQINLEVAKLIVIESVETHAYQTEDRGFIYGVLEPFAVITCCPDSTRAIDMQANPISLSELTRVVPELKEMIGGLPDG
jgi:hypothetical protein